MEVGHKIKKVLCVNSEPSFLEQQKKELKHKDLDGNLISFTNLTDAFQFLETQVIEKNDKLHYIVIDESSENETITHSLEKLQKLNPFLKKTDIIFITEQNNTFLRNRVMQYPFVTVFLVKPVPSNYIKFLITGQLS